MSESNKEDRIVKTACHLCHGGCILIAHVRDGKLVKLQGDPDGPLNRGSMCEKAAAIEYIYSPYRLRYPLKRTGARGEGKWQRISWDEALDIVVEKLQGLKGKYGGEGITYCAGTGRVVVSSTPCENFLEGVLGIPNRIGIGHICLSKTRQPVVLATIGRIPGLAGRGVFRDFERTNCIVAWGDSLMDSNNDYIGMAGKRISDALKRGAKLVVIDPIFTRAAQKAHIWLQIRPGTDIALALSWLNIIINENLYDRDFVENWSNAPFLVRSDTGRLLTENEVFSSGSTDNCVIWDHNNAALHVWDTSNLSYYPTTVKPTLVGKYKVKLADGSIVECKPVWQLLTDVVEEWTPEKAAEITWLSADDIRESARMYAANRPACIEWGLGTSQCTRQTATNQAILQLKAIMGNLDIPGGNPFWINPGFKTLRGVGRVSHTLSSEEKDKCITAGFAFNKEISAEAAAHSPSVWKAIITGKPYSIKALIGHSSNPLLTQENPDNYILEALKKLDFIVWFDITMTPSNEWADIILPVSTPFERNWCNECDMGIFAGQAVMESQWESRSDFDIYRELCVRMGRADAWPWKTDREFCDWRLEGTGITFDELTRSCFKPAPEVWRKYEKGMLRDDGKPGFPTDSGKVEIYSSSFSKRGLAPLPVFSYPPESFEITPELSKEFPLILIAGARGLNTPYFHSQYHILPRLRKIQPYPNVLINPETIQSLKIKDGDWIWVETRKGRAKFKSKATEGIHPKVVAVPHAWWYPELPGPNYGVLESNVNLLLDPFGVTDPASGTPELRGLLCRVYKVEE